MFNFKLIIKQCDKTNLYCVDMFTLVASLLEISLIIFWSNNLKFVVILH